MRGNELLNLAFDVLGYTENAAISQTITRAQARGLLAVNETYAETLRALGLPYRKLDNINDELVFPLGTSDYVLRYIMPYGVAEKIAQGEGDTDMQNYCAYIYNERRLSLSRFDKIKDVLPGVW